MRWPDIPAAERFWAKVNKTDTCWLWTGAQNKSGSHRYGFFGVRTGVIDHAHRVAWILTHGPIPARQRVHQLCGNRLCVRPEHLCLGGTADRAQARFWKNVRKTDGCWLWNGVVSPFGYGQFTMGRKKRGYAHRFSYEWTHGPIPEGLHVLHRCDVPLCVNPAHLFLGNQADNMRDMMAKGRSCRGEKQHNAKLTAAQVREIRARYTVGGVSHSELAAIFGVARPTISVILENKRWRHLINR